MIAVKIEIEVERLFQSPVKDSDGTWHMRTNTKTVVVLKTGQYGLSESAIVLEIDGLKYQLDGDELVSAAQRVTK